MYSIAVSMEIKTDPHNTYETGMEGSLLVQVLHYEQVSSYNICINILEIYSISNTYTVTSDQWKQFPTLMPSTHFPFEKNQY